MINKIPCRSMLLSCSSLFLRIFFLSLLSNLFLLFFYLKMKVCKFKKGSSIVTRDRIYKAKKQINKDIQPFHCFFLIQGFKKVFSLFIGKILLLRCFQGWQWQCVLRGMELIQTNVLKKIHKSIRISRTNKVINQ